MTGNCYCDPVCCASSRHCPGRGWLSDILGDVAVGARFAEGNRLQIRPHAALKSCGLDVERKCRIQLLARHVAQQFLRPLLYRIVIAAAIGKWEFMLQAVFKFFIRISELNCANTFGGSGNEHPA